jgi:hypothetical protein
MILGVLIVMRREYAPAHSTLYSGLNQLICIGRRAPFLIDGKCSARACPHALSRRRESAGFAGFWWYYGPGIAMWRNFAEISCGSSGRSRWRRAATDRPAA